MVRDRTEVDIGGLLEGARLGRFHVLTVVFGFFVLMVDGIDFSAGVVAAPSILTAFGAERSQVGLLFGWTNAGLLIGSIIFGFLGDRLGRRTAAILGVLTYTLPAFAVAYADSMTQLMVLRFITGLGMGGVIPNAIALVTENAPKRLRATFVIIVFLGYATGSVLIGGLAARYIALHGWPVVFIVAGIAGAILSVVLALFLPESMRWLALKKPDATRLARQMRLLAPQIEAGPETRFVIRQETSAPFSVKLLFAGDQRWVTPLLWIAFFFEGLTFQTLLSWLPVLLVSLGLTASDGALTFAYGTVAGMVALAILARPLDRWGPIASMVVGVLAVAAIVAMGLPGLSHAAVMVVAVIALMCAGGTHNSLNGTVGIFYPTAFRSNGVGYATGAGRVASVVGPTLAGFLLSANMPVAELLYLIAAPNVVVVFACLALGGIYKRKFAANAVAAPAAAEAPAAAAV